METIISVAILSSDPSVCSCVQVPRALVHQDLLSEQGRPLYLTTQQVGNSPAHLSSAWAEAAGLQNSGPVDWGWE
jgi:hypothetical protein